MIDVTRETLITFSELARLLPRRRGDRPVHVATIHRWRSRGLKSICLEGVRVGGAWHTSWEAFRRFTDRLTAQAESKDNSDLAIPLPRPPGTADVTLESSGW